jgi:hypothetical protein
MRENESGSVEMREDESRGTKGGMEDESSHLAMVV